MSESAIELGTFVRHDTLGVGRVTSHDDSDRVLIEFKSVGDRYMSQRVVSGLEILPDDGLEVLLWTQPDETRAWATDAPLKLLAATLADIGDKVKAGVIQDKLEGRVLDDGVKWGTWWGKVRSSAGESRYFTTVKNKKNAVIAIGLSPGAHVRDIPAEPLPEKPSPSRKLRKKSPSTREWKEWLLGETEESAPGPAPRREAVSGLHRWPTEGVQRALAQTIRGAREFLDSGSTTSKTTGGWLDALSRVTLRWRDCTENDSTFPLTRQAGELLPRLSVLVENDGAEQPILKGSLLARPDDWHRALTAGIWTALNDHPCDIRDLFRALCLRLARENPAMLAEEICLAAFDAGESTQRNLQLDALLDTLSVGARPRLLYNLIVRAAAGGGPKEGVVDYVSATRHATDSNVRLGLLALSSLLIPDGRPQATAEASRRLADALESPDADGGPVQAMFQQVRERNEEFRARIADEFEARQEAQRQVYEERLERGRREEAHLRQQLAAFSSHMASGREESRLEVRQDMLLAIGDVLQRAHGPGRSAEERLVEVIATIPTALQAGAADALGTVGETVRFEPRLHHSTEGLARGAPARVSAPGVIVRGGTAGDRVILKAAVSRQPRR